MVELTGGDILKDGSEAIVNTVNCVGVMGRGLALQFKNAWPENFKAYAAACKRSEVRPGRMFVWDTGQLTPPRTIINFPTKRHWRDKSRVEDIDAGLMALVSELQQRGIRSVAIPPLGSGLGGLAWSEVRPRIEAAMRAVPDVRVRIYEPVGASKPLMGGNGEPPVRHPRGDEPPSSPLQDLLPALRELIRQGRQRALRAVDMVQVRTCWEIGRHIVEFEQGGALRAAYGKKLLPQLAAALSAEFGKGFDERNLRHMRGFYGAFPIWDAVRTELSWTHYRTLLRVGDGRAREWYMAEAAAQNWSARALERQIGTLYFDRLLLSTDKADVTAEADAALAALPQTPREFVRDPVMLEFLGLPGSGKLLESRLEQALMDKLQAFLLELGKGFAFVARQQRISTESQDFYIDLVFYNYLLKCFVLIDLKTHQLTHQDIGQMDMYVRMYDDLKRGEGDNPSVGILLCEHKDQSVVRYSVLHESAQLFASKYRLVLPSEDELRLEIEREREAIEAAKPWDTEE